MCTTISERRVREKLAAHFGAEQVERVEPLSEHAYRARLAGGGLAVAIIQEDGAVTVRELEAVC